MDKTNRIYYVYKHLTKDTGELFYIGKGKNKRAMEKSGSRNKLWKNIANKHGFVVEFIKQNLLEEEALILEKEEIEKYKPEANFSIGGLGGATGYKHTAESLKRRAETQSKLKSTPEAKLKSSILAKEIANRPEVKEKKRKSWIAWWAKVSNGEIANPLKGRVWKEESIRKISEAQKGEKGYWYGKTTTVAKSVTNLNTGQTFKSLKEAAASVGGKNFRSLTRRIQIGKPYKKNLFVFSGKNNE